VARRHRLIFGCRHNTGSSTVAALVHPPHLTALTSQVTNYGWSIKQGSALWLLDTGSPPIP
jgi:hypothetical protein